MIHATETAYSQAPTVRAEKQARERSPNGENVKNNDTCNRSAHTTPNTTAMVELTSMYIATSLPENEYDT